MALPATDSFTGTDTQDLTAYSANWTLNRGGFKIFSPAGQSEMFPAFGPGGECGAGWNADTFANDQYAKAIVSASGAGTEIGVGVRHSATGAVESYYHFYGHDSESYVAKMVTGTWTQLGSSRTGFTATDEIYIDVVGTTITAKINGIQQGTTESDAALAAGRAGVAGFTNDATTTTNRLSSWEGGNVGAAAADPIRQDRAHSPHHQAIMAM